MRIGLVCNDTRGGVVPYVALGLGLANAGHEVRAVAPSDQIGLFTEVGLRCAPLSGSVEEVMRASQGAAERGSLAAMRLAARELPGRLLAWTREALQACEGVDLVTGGVGGMVVGLAVADLLARPFVEAQLQPLGAPTDAYPGLLLPGFPRWLGGWGRRLSHHLSDQALWIAFRGPMKRVRRELGLPPSSHATDGMPALYGFSRLVVPIPESGERVRVATGYWPPPVPSAWAPPADLVAFLARPGPVVAIGFGSMASEDPQAVARLVVGAARDAKVRAVLVAGWGGLAAASEDDVFFCPQVPYEWLLRKVSAVVHHGGAGTTGAGLRAGIPSVVVPFLLDQPFWGARVAALGVGPEPIPRRRLTQARLAQALERAVSDSAMRERAAALGERLRSEDGVAQAVRQFETAASKALREGDRAQGGDPRSSVEG